MKNWLIAANVAVALGTPGPAAVAQESQPSVGTLAEVVVTANRREQKALDVSASISVLDAEALREFPGQNVASLAARIPGLQVQENDLFPAYFMRGVGLLTETNDLNDQPVGTYLDDVYLGAPSLSRGQLFDVARIEVLRGPQGTLFGRNTSAGLIQYVTQGPTAQADGYAQVGFSSFDRRTFEGAYGGPLSDRVRVRVSGNYVKDDGWQRDQFTGQKFAVTDLWSLRGQAAIDLTPNLELLTKLEYAKQDNTGTRYGFSGLFDPADGAPCTPAQVNAQQCAAANDYIARSLDPRHPATDDPALDELETRAVTARLAYKGAAFNFTSITAYRDLQRGWIADGDATPLPFFGGAMRFTTYRTTDAHQWSQEARFDGSASFGNWVVGAYFYKDERDFLTSFPHVFGGNQTVSNLQTRSLAAFGQLDYRLTDTVTVVAGLRYSDETRDIVQVATTDLLDPDTTVTDSRKTKDGRTTGRLTAEWRPRDGLMLYGGASTGFKSGTFAQSLNVARGIVSVAPEEVTTYELGLKGRLWDGRGQLALTLYNNNYRDFQATGSTIDPVTQTPVNLLRNVGKLRANGVEAELTLLPLDSLQVNLGFTYTDTRVSSTQNSGEYDVETGELYYYDGNPAANTPKTRVNGSIRWMAPPVSVGQLGALVAFNWQDEVNLSASGNRYLRQEAYGTVDLTGLWESPTRHYYGQLFVQNLTNEQVAGSQFLIDFIGTRATVWGLAPRTYGVRVGVNF